MIDITPEHEAEMRRVCTGMIYAQKTYMGSISWNPHGQYLVQQYIEKVSPEIVMLMLDMGNQMTDAVERINELVNRAGFDNLEQALKAIERIGRLQHG